MSASILEPVAVERPAQHGQAHAIRGKLCDGSVPLRNTTRAFAVVVGPSVAVDVLAAASLVATATAVCIDGCLGDG